MKYDIDFYCPNCGKKQPPDKIQDIPNFIQYTCGIKCDCGTEFTSRIIEIPSTRRKKKSNESNKENI